MDWLLLIGGVVFLAGILLVLTNPFIAVFCLIVGGGLVVLRAWFLKPFSS